MSAPNAWYLGPHVLVRKTYWFSLFWLPILPFWITHGVMCPLCGAWEPLSMQATQEALRTETLRLNRRRPLLRDALLKSDLTDPRDWHVLGLEPGATPEEVQSGFRRIAKASHPDVGGSEEAFARASAAYRRITEGRIAPLPTAHDVDEVASRVERNPHRGFFDIYLKAWPVLAVAVVIMYSVAGS